MNFKNIDLFEYNGKISLVMDHLDVDQEKAIALLDLAGWDVDKAVQVSQ